MKYQSFKDVKTIPDIRRFAEQVGQMFKVTLSLSSPRLALSTGFECNSQHWSPFCRTFQKLGKNHCLKCDKHHAIKMSHEKKTHRYTCHMGLTEIMVPILSNGEIIASLQTGQILDAFPTPATWKTVEERLSGLSIPSENLQSLYFNTRVMFPKEQEKLVAFLELMAEIIAQYHADDIQNAIRTGNVIMELRRYVKQHIAEKLTTATVAKGIGFSPRTITYALQKEKKGANILRFVQEWRVLTSAQCLVESNLPVAIIASRCGFGTLQQFHRTFRCFMGITPLDYRRQTHPHQSGCAA